MQFTPQYGDSFIELLRLELLEKLSKSASVNLDDFDTIYANIERLCVNSEPTYGVCWCFLRARISDSPRAVLRIAKENVRNSIENSNSASISYFFWSYHCNTTYFEWLFFQFWVNIRLQILFFDGNWVYIWFVLFCSYFASVKSAASYQRVIHVKTRIFLVQISFWSIWTSWPRFWALETITLVGRSPKRDLNRFSTDFASKSIRVTLVFTILSNQRGNWLSALRFNRYL